MLGGLVKLIRYMDSLSGPADLKTVERLLLESDVTTQDMIEACKFDNHRYARNLLAKSKWYELMVICWRSGQSSPIHDHIGTTCGVRVISGTATETIYQETANGRVRPVGSQVIKTGAVILSQDEDIHLITNHEADQGLVTLHLYTPPLQMRFYQLEGEWDDS